MFTFVQVCLDKDISEVGYNNFPLKFYVPANLRTLTEHETFSFPHIVGNAKMQVIFLWL